MTISSSRLSYLRASFIFVFASCLAQSLLLGGQAQNEACPGPGQPVPIQKIANGVLGEIKDPGTSIIRNQKEWEEMWRRLGLPLNPAPAAPKIDFSSQMVVGVFGGEKRGLLEIEVTRVERRQDCLVVLVTQRKVPSSIPVSQFERFRPFHLVRLPASSQRVVFQYTSVVR